MEVREDGNDDEYHYEDEKFEVTTSFNCLTVHVHVQGCGVIRCLTCTLGP